MTRYTFAGFTMPQLSIMTGGMLSTLGIAALRCDPVPDRPLPIALRCPDRWCWCCFDREAILECHLHAPRNPPLHDLRPSVPGDRNDGELGDHDLLIEQLMMAAISAGHITAGYGAYLHGKPVSEGDVQTCGTSLAEDAGLEAVTISDILGSPDERIVPGAVMAVAAD